MARNRMTKEDKSKWDDIYDMMRNVLGYDEYRALPAKVTLRLRGLRNGKFMDNMNVKNKRDYSYEVIWVAFKMSMPTIKAALSSKTFEDEDHKINYAIKIIEGKLDDAYIRLKNKDNS